MIEVAHALAGARAHVAAEAEFPLAAVAVDAHFVGLALVVAAAAVLRVGVLVNARAVALIEAVLALSNAHSVLAERGVATADGARLAAVLRAGLEVDTLAVDHCQTGFAGTLTVVAELRVAATLETLTAVLRVVLGVDAVVVVAADGETAVATANARCTHAEVVVAVVAAHAAMIEIARQVGAGVSAGNFTRRANARARNAGGILRTVIAARAAVVDVGGKVGANALELARNRAHWARCTLT